MKPKHVFFACLGIIAAVLAWDVFLYTDNVAGNSISQVIWDWSRAAPILPAMIGFVVGFLFCHFFGDGPAQPR